MPTILVFANSIFHSYQSLDFVMQKIKVFTKVHKNYKRNSWTYLSNCISIFLFSGPHLPEFLLPFRKPKRIRTAFSPSQLLKLEQAFEKNQYVVGAERKELAKHLNLSETQVRNKTNLAKKQYCFGFVSEEKKSS